MRAFVLCAGLGTRMAPLTNAQPKPALPMLGVPIIGYTFAHLKAQGVTSLVINTHHLPAEMERVAADWAERLALPLQVSPEPVIQGTGGALREAAKYLRGDEPFILWNGDILGEVELAAALTAHRDSGALATMILRPMPPGETYGAVEVDGASAVKRIAGRGQAESGLTAWHFSGIHIVDPRVLDAVPREGAACINRDVYLSLIASGKRVHGHVTDSGYWSDLGTPARYLATQAELLHGALDFTRFPGVTPLAPASATGVWRKLGAKVTTGVALAGPVWLGPQARLDAAGRAGPNASINGHVGAGGQVIDAALLEGEVAAGETLQGAIRLGVHTAR